jgi:hypothetical protein
VAANGLKETIRSYGLPADVIVRGFNATHNYSFGDIIRLNAPMQFVL